METKCHGSPELGVYWRRVGGVERLRGEGPREIGDLGRLERQRSQRELRHIFSILPILPQEHIAHAAGKIC